MKRQNSSEKITTQIEATPNGVFVEVFIADNLGDYSAFIYNDRQEVVSPNMLWVKPAARGRGLGEKMMRALVREAESLGVERFAGHVESQYALAIRARVFGKEALKFFADEETGDPEIFPELYDELPITYEQAIMSLQRSEQYENDLDMRRHGFSVEIDLSNWQSDPSNK